MSRLTLDGSCSGTRGTGVSVIGLTAVTVDGTEIGSSTSTEFGGADQGDTGGAHTGTNRVETSGTSDSTSVRARGTSSNSGVLSVGSRTRRKTEIDHLAVNGDRSSLLVTIATLALRSTSGTAIASFLRLSDDSISAVDRRKSGTTSQNVRDSEGSIGEFKRTRTRDTSSNGQWNKLLREGVEDFVYGARPVTGRSRGEASKGRAGSDDVSLIETTRGSSNGEGSIGSQRSQEGYGLRRGTVVVAREGGIETSSRGLASDVGKYGARHGGTTLTPMV